MGICGSKHVSKPVEPPKIKSYQEGNKTSLPPDAGAVSDQPKPVENQPATPIAHNLEEPCDNDPGLTDEQVKTLLSKVKLESPEPVKAAKEHQAQVYWLHHSNPANELVMLVRPGIIVSYPSLSKLFSSPPGSQRSPKSFLFSGSRLVVFTDGLPVAVCDPTNGLQIKSGANLVGIRHKGAWPVSGNQLYFQMPSNGQIVRVNLDTFEEVVLDKLADNIADFLVDENQTITYLTSQGELRQENPDNSSIPKTCVNLKTDSTTGGEWIQTLRVGTRFISAVYKRTSHTFAVSTRLKKMSELNVQMDINVEQSYALTSLQHCIVKNFHFLIAGVRKETLQILLLIKDKLHFATQRKHSDEDGFLSSLMVISPEEIYLATKQGLLKCSLVVE